MSKYACSHRVYDKLAKCCISNSVQYTHYWSLRIKKEHLSGFDCVLLLFIIICVYKTDLGILLQPCTVIIMKYKSTTEYTYRKVIAAATDCWRVTLNEDGINFTEN